MLKRPYTQLFARSHCRVGRHDADVVDGEVLWIEAALKRAADAARSLRR